MPFPTSVVIVGASPAGPTATYLLTREGIPVTVVHARMFPVKNPRNFDYWVINQSGRRLFEIFFKTCTESVGHRLQGNLGSHIPLVRHSTVERRQDAETATPSTLDKFLKAPTALKSLLCVGSPSSPSLSML